MRLSKLATCAALATSLALASCASYETEVSAVGVHQGHTNANKSILLSNIIRASFGWEPTFVKAGSVTATSSANIGSSASIPFGPDAVNAYSLSPSIGASKKHAIKVIDYGASKAAINLYANLGRAYLRDLVSFRGWPPAVATTFLFHRVRIDFDLLKFLYKRSLQICNQEKENLICARNIAIEEECELQARTVFINDPRARCKYLLFFFFLNILAINGVVYNTRPKSDDDDQIDISFRDAVAEKEYEELVNGANSPSGPIELNTRSPSDLIKYLGQIAAAQLHLDRPYIPSVQTLNGRVVLFEAARELEKSEEVAVAVRVDGKTYFVPAPDPVAEDRARSVELMAYIIELLNRSQSGSEVVPGLPLVQIN